MVTTGGNMYFHISKFYGPSKSRRDTIFAGAFGEFGYWFVDSTGFGLQYKSLISMDPLLDFEQDELWNIVVANNEVYGQSFGRVFKNIGISSKPFIPLIPSATSITLQVPSLFKLTIEVYSSWPMTPSAR